MGSADNEPPLVELSQMTGTETQDLLKKGAECCARNEWDAVIGRFDSLIAVDSGYAAVWFP